MLLAFDGFTNDYFSLCFFVRHKSECPNEQIFDIIIQVLLVSIVHQSKGPLGSHERPDPSDHVAELEGLEGHEVDLSSHPAKGSPIFYWVDRLVLAEGCVNVVH